MNGDAIESSIISTWSLFPRCLLRDHVEWVRPVTDWMKGELLQVGAYG